MVASVTDPTFLPWKQYRLIMSALSFSLSTKILHLVVDCQTSYTIWLTLEEAPSNPRII
uniref:Uncharacterized protein n=1 Tax=Salix viminalis TaxID=40686 RepID=A0A6N2MLL5_SALVM